jgi:thiamine pyrophosphate-dependent acetolactate synthase large subunit-like protein
LTPEASSPSVLAVRVNEAIARILSVEGVEFLFCFPAHGVIDACAAEGIRPIITRTERTLVNMADGYTRVHNARRFGVCAVQAGPGAENAFGGVAQAASDGIPILVLPGGPRRDRRGVPYAFSAAEQYRGVAKWSDEVNLPERIPDLMRRAFSALRNGRRGPVVLEIPNDVGAAEVDASAVAAYAPPRAYRSSADPTDVQAAADALVRAERPVIVAGQGVLFADATDELRTLAELLGASVMTTMNGKSAFPEDHPLALGAAGATGTAAAAKFLENADLIFGAGTSFSVTPFVHPLPRHVPLIQLTSDERDINKDYVVRAALVGDAKLVLAQLIAAIKGDRKASPRADLTAKIASTKKDWLAEWQPRLDSADEPLSPYRVLADLGRTIDRARAIVTHDSGNPRDQLLPFYEAVTPRGYLGWGKSTQLGYGYGLALGAKLASPERLVVNVMGDAAFGMVGMDVETAVRERIGVLTILLNNSAMGGYSRSMPIAAARYGTARQTREYTQVAAGLGAHAERITHCADIGPAIARASAITMEGRPAVLEFITREEPVLSRFFTPTY